MTTSHPASTDAGVDDAEQLSEDEMFHLLQCRRRRDALRYLRDADGPVAMRDLAEQVAAWEHDTTVRELASDQRQRVYIPLYQTHLPKLDEHDVVDYDKHRGTVERAANAPTLDPYLDGMDVPETDDVAVPWQRFYLGTSSLGAVAIGGAAFELPVASALPGVAIGVLVFGLFCLLTLGRLLGDLPGRSAHG